MPSTDRDEALIASMPPGTRVKHWKYGVGTVGEQAIEYGQIGVDFDEGGTCYCYPTSLELVGPTVPAGEAGTIMTTSDGGVVRPGARQAVRRSDGVVTWRSLDGAWHRADETIAASFVQSWGDISDADRDLVSHVEGDWFDPVGGDDASAQRDDALEAIRRAVSLGLAGESISGVSHLVGWLGDHGYTLPEPAQDV